MGRQAAVRNGLTGRIAYQFHARDLHLVMGPLRRHSPVRFRVSIDGQPPGRSHGVDVDDGGTGTVVEALVSVNPTVETACERRFEIRQPGAIADRTFEIEFLDSGVEAFAFTFG
jgi:hypothetical protein